MPTDTFSVAPPDGGAVGTGDAYDDRGATQAWTTTANYNQNKGSSTTTSVVVTGLSFPITVPLGATITNAYVKIWAYAVGTNDIPKGRVSVQPIPNPSKWADSASLTAGNPAYRFFNHATSSTPGYTVYTFDETAWDGAWTGDGNGYVLPSITTEIQTIIDHATYDPAGAASVRTVNVMVAGLTTAHTWTTTSRDNAVPAQANQKPLLVIEYTTAGSEFPGTNDPVDSKMNLAAVGETYSPVLTGVMIPLEFGPSSSIGALDDMMAYITLEEVPPDAFPGYSYPTSVMRSDAGTGTFVETNGFFVPATATVPTVSTVVSTATLTLEANDFPSTPTTSNTVVNPVTTGKLDAVTVDFVLSSAPLSNLNVAGTGLFTQTSGFFVPADGTVLTVVSASTTSQPGTSGGITPSVNAEVYGVANVSGTGLFFRDSLPTADLPANSLVTVISTGSLTVVTSDLPISTAPDSKLRVAGSAAFYSPSTASSTGSYIRSVPSTQRGPGAPVNTRRRRR